MRLWIIGRRILLRRKGLHLYRAGKGGRILLRDEARWYHVNGIGLNTSRGAVVLEFRRVPKGAQRMERI